MTGDKILTLGPVHMTERFRFTVKYYKETSAKGKMRRWGVSNDDSAQGGK